MSSIDRVNISSTSLDSSYAVQKKDQVRVGQSGQDGKSSSSSQDDSIALSSTAKDVDRFAGLVGQSRQDRLDQVQQMINSGTYNVSGKDIAAKLIESNRK